MCWFESKKAKWSNTSQAAITVSICRQKNNPLYAINYKHAQSKRELFSMCWFYSLGGEARLVGRMCFGLTGKWYTVISELLPRFFLSSHSSNRGSSKSQMLSQYRGWFTIFFLSWLHLGEFVKLATFSISVMTGKGSSLCQVAWMWMWPAHLRFDISNFNIFCRH